MFTIEKIDELLKKYNGNYSLIFPLIKDKFMDEIAKNPLSGLHEGEEYFFYEFAFFEVEYMNIKKDILINGYNNTIVDIGCQFGLQSEIFLDNNYIGIECMEKVFLNKKYPNINYIRGLFPNDIDIDLKDKIVISNMSLGYFNNLFKKEKGNIIKERTISDTDMLIIKALSKAKILYYNGYPHITEELKKYFKNCEKIGDNKDSVAFVSSGLYKFYN